MESKSPPMRALEFISYHVTFKLPYDFSYQMKTPINTYKLNGTQKRYKMAAPARSIALILATPDFQTFHQIKDPLSRFWNYQPNNHEIFFSYFKYTKN
jgi:hypothetical protein